MINLLPPKEKQLLAQEKTKIRVVVLGAVALFSVLCAILILFFLKIHIESQVHYQAAILEQAKSETAHMQIQGSKIAELNETFSKLDQFYQQAPFLVPFLRKLANTFPTGLYLTNFSYRKDNAQFLLSGIAPTREILSQFKENLEADPSFSDVYFPPASWIKSEDISFSISLKAAKTALHK